MVGSSLEPSCETIPLSVLSGGLFSDMKESGEQCTVVFALIENTV
jgi:hypothetical protein